MNVRARDDLTPPTADVRISEPTASASSVDALGGRAKGRLWRASAVGRRRRLVFRALVAADAVGIVLAYLVALAVFGTGRGDAGSASPALEIQVLVISLPVWILLAQLFGMYSRDDEYAGHSNVDDVPVVFTVVTIGTWLFVATVALLGLADPYIPRFVAFWLGAVFIILVCRAIARTVFCRRPGFVQNTLILGAGEIGQRVASKIARHPEYGINVVGFVDSDQAVGRDDVGEVAVVGSQDDLGTLVETLDVERVIVAFSSEDLVPSIPELRQLRSRNIQVDLVPRFYDLVGPGAGFHTVEGLPLVSLAPTRLSVTQQFTKRGADVLLSFVGIVFLAPLFAYAVVRIKRDSPGPTFFPQVRSGLNGKPFRLWKFRTMFVGDPESGQAHRLTDPLLLAEFERNFKLRDDPRVTPFGQWLRRTSLDELPQLWNVLRGNMSLVGPRPLVLDEVERWEGCAAELLAAKPGMTGYWQINGRSDADYAERVRLELSYVANYTVWLDLTILAKTVTVITTRRGAV